MDKQNKSIKGYSLIKDNLYSFILEFIDVVDDLLISTKYILLKTNPTDNSFDISLLDEEEVMKIMAKEPNVVSLTDEQIRRLLNILIKSYENQRKEEINYYDDKYINNILDNYKLILKDDYYNNKDIIKKDNKINIDTKINDNLYIKNKKKLLTSIKGRDIL